MGLFESVFSGIGHVVGTLFSSQIDFLTGKSCSTVCGPTWDLECYIENFCIQHLLKFFAVSLLFYVVLLFLYFLYKLGVFHCLCRTSCKMIWVCLSTIFVVWVHACYWLCRCLQKVKREHRRHQREMEMLDMMSVRSDQDTDMEASSTGSRWRRSSYQLRNHKRNHLRRSLRPRNHRVRLGVDGDLDYATKRKHIGHGDVRVVQTSSFARRGRYHKRSRHLSKRT
ncbi:hypothetical protein OSB04_031051 [Centaurea solstitialis]|uniref:Transmembrane protein n=1 Tax=Centaurea solstitialis TaxID=347529 RepID=A0AA38S9L8_9ASTR|nr:hypothetical protein OSB04_031051 [Centaurea solstitialis]